MTGTKESGSARTVAPSRAMDRFLKFEKLGLKCPDCGASMVEDTLSEKLYFCPKCHTIGGRQ